MDFDLGTQTTYIGIGHLLVAAIPKKELDTFLTRLHGFANEHEDGADPTKKRQARRALKIAGAIKRVREEGSFGEQA